MESTKTHIKILLHFIISSETKKKFRGAQVLQEMLDHIDRQQRNKLKLDNLSIPSPERHRPLRHQFSSDNMHVQPFNIPNLRIDQRKTSSAEDMARKNSAGQCHTHTLVYIFQLNGNMKVEQSSILIFLSCLSFFFCSSIFCEQLRIGSTSIGAWWFGNSPSSPDSNFLRVANAFPNRRLSDNTLMTPKIRIAPSCASSPGGTPGQFKLIHTHILFPSKYKLSNNTVN